MQAQRQLHRAKKIQLLILDAQGKKKVRVKRRVSYQQRNGQTGRQRWQRRKWDPARSQSAQEMLRSAKR